MNDNRRNPQFRGAHYELLAAALGTAKKAIAVTDNTMAGDFTVKYKLNGYGLAEYYIIQTLIHDNPKFNLELFQKAINKIANK